MKKGQVLEGTIEKVEFPNKGVVTVAEEGKSVIVKNGIPGQKVKFCVNKFKRGNAEGRLLEVLEKSFLLCGHLFEAANDADSLYAAFSYNS